MKPTLQIRLGQSLTLTPQLRLAIRLLQLSAVELEVEINDAVDSNPLLEREEDEADAPVFEPGQAGSDVPDDAPLDLQSGEVESFGESDAFDDTGVPGLHSCDEELFDSAEFQEWRMLGRSRARALPEKW